MEGSAVFVRLRGSSWRCCFLALGWFCCLLCVSEARGTGGVDFTLLFRSLVDAPVGPGEGSGAGASAEDPHLSFVHRAAMEEVRLWPQEHRDGWAAWARKYGARIQKEKLDPVEREEMMRLANPKYILRNAMAAEAYEAAARGDFSIVRERVATGPLLWKIPPTRVQR